MIIRYIFANGDISEIEVEGEVAELMDTLRKEEQANEKYEQRHTCSLEAAVYEGMDFADKETTASILKRKKQSDILEEALSTLTPIQRKRFELFADGKTTREIAKIEGVCQTMICKSIKQSQVKLQFFLKKRNFF